ncbi:MAG TPA: transglycosylase SLT domain-containing protein [Rhodanobacteraceae bacterium]|nr:transglycosylase SLT domain-containing protein [Rhodanobacteraceae bacterium]
MPIDALPRGARYLLLALIVGFAVSPAAAQERVTQRDAFRAAYAAATRNPPGDWKKLAAGLEDYPLYPYLEAAVLRRNIAKAPRADIERFLTRWAGSLPESDLREAYLRELARRGDWTSFRVFWNGSRARDLQCNALQARLAAGEKLDFDADIAPVWSNPRALPSACDGVLGAARASGSLTDARVWDRLSEAAASGNTESARAAAALLAGRDREAAERIVDAVRNPSATLAKADQWSDEPRARDAIAYGLARYARRDSASAETLWARLGDKFKWDEAQKDRVLNALAVYRSTSYSPDALARLKALPSDAKDDASREWHVRIALAAADWNETLAALDDLSLEQKTDSRWRYLRARVLGKLGRKDEAAAIFADVAREASFHGFLAADWIGAPYAICPRTLATDPAAEKSIANQGDLARAFEFHALGMLPEARREWDFAMRKLDESEKRLAADLAFRRGWYDRAVFLYSADPETQRLYEQRFPLAQETRVRREAADAGIDPAWAYAIIRAESAWMTDAHSHADAYGLMQLLPGVAKQLAKSEKLSYNRPSDLFDPALNIELGTRYLGRMADRYDGSPWLASAAYNAGEAPVGRWLDARGTLDPDFFIETIPYKETREYVARVLAFSVIYDWRMNGKALALSARMPRFGQAYAAPTDATPRKGVVCAAEATPAAGTTQAEKTSP